MKHEIRRILIAVVSLVILLAPLGFGAEASTSEAIPLPAFLAGANEPPELSAAVELCVAVNHCEYGEPLQLIRDPKIVEQAASILSAMKVEGLHDLVSSTATYCSYGLYDAQGKCLISVEFQDGLLVGGDGRYDVSGLDALWGLDGVMLADDWDEYWAQASEAEDEYARSLRVAFPASIFTVQGLAASQLRETDVLHVSISVSWNKEAGRLSTDDPAMIRRIFAALQTIQATGDAPEDGEGQRYYVTLVYMEPEGRFERSVSFGFEGDRLECGELTYALSGLDGLCRTYPPAGRRCSRSKPRPTIPRMARTPPRLSRAGGRPPKTAASSTFAHSAEPSFERPAKSM